MENLISLGLFATSAVLMMLGLGTFMLHGLFGEGLLTIERGLVSFFVGLAAFLLGRKLGREVYATEHRPSQRPSREKYPRLLTVSNDADFHAPFHPGNPKLLEFRDHEGGMVATVSRTGSLPIWLLKALTYQKQTYLVHSADGNLLCTVERPFGIVREKAILYSTDGSIIARSHSTILLRDLNVEIRGPGEQILLRIHSDIYNPIRFEFSDANGNKVATLTKSLDDILKTATRGTLSWSLEFKPNLDEKIHLIAMAHSTFSLYPKL